MKFTRPFSLLLLLTFIGVLTILLFVLIGRSNPNDDFIDAMQDKDYKRALVLLKHGVDPNLPLIQTKPDVSLMDQLLILMHLKPVPVKVSAAAPTALDRLIESVDHYEGEPTPNSKAKDPDLLALGVELVRRGAAWYAPPPNSTRSGNRGQLAIEAGMAPIVAAMLEKGLAPNQIYSARVPQSPLDIAITNRDAEMVEVLLKHNADPFMSYCFKDPWWENLDSKDKTTNKILGLLRKKRYEL